MKNEVQINSTNQLVTDLPEEPNLAIGLISERFLKLVIHLGQELKFHNEYLEGFGILTAYAESKGISLKNHPNITDEKAQNITDIIKFVNAVNANSLQYRNQLLVEKTKSKYKLVFGSEFCYEFTEGDLKQIQSILNELRDLITNSKEFEEDHKRRLLNKLEKLQKELHKKVSTLDNIWGLVGDAGVVIGKFGEDAKPIVDRITALVNIVWRVQSMAEELPLGTPYPLLKESAATFNDGIESPNDDASKMTEEK